MQLFTDEQLDRAEAYLAAEKYDEIRPALEGLVADAQTYIDETYEPDDKTQWFSFANQFELLTYKRVEQDPRELKPAARPFDRAFADLAFCEMQMEDFEPAAEHLKQAVRWNPMNCAHRLNLAVALGNCGDLEESLRMTYSVFARASHSSHLVRAYTNFADYFVRCEQYETAAACVKCGLRMHPDDHRLNNMATELALKHQTNPNEQTDELTESLLDAQGIPQTANVEVVLSALLLADIAAAREDMQTCQDMAQVAVDLVGQERATALAQMVREAGEDAYPEEGGAAPLGSDATDDAAQAALDAATRAARAGADVAVSKGA
ncbi:hypothetical protein I3I95_10390 [bacterium]|nr:hypothetical protein [bacterium]